MFLSAQARLGGARCRHGPGPFRSYSWWSPTRSAMELSPTRPGRMAISRGSPISNFQWVQSGWKFSEKSRPGRAGPALCFHPRPISPAHTLGIELENLMIGNAADVEHTIARFAREPDGGLIVLPDTATVCHRKLIVSSAAKHRLHAIYPYRYFATSGGLVSYGVDTVDLYARGAAYVDRILRGAKPGDLPVQAPAKFELVINKAAAKNLGLDISPVLMAYANEIIG